MTNQELQEQAEKMYPEYPTEPKGETRYNKDINCFKKRKAFIAGAKWMQEQDKWISCDLKPEKEFIDILLLFENECACSGYYVKEYDVFMPHSIMYRGLTVTHWQPLPPSPKTK